MNFHTQSTYRQISWEELPTQLKDLMGDSCEAVHLLGSNSWFSLVPLFSCPPNFVRPQLLVLSEESEMESFTQAVRFFNPEIEIHCLRGFDVSPYSQLHPHPRIMCERMNWLYRAQNATRGEIFLTTIHGLSQLTIPLEAFLEHTKILQLNNELPSNFLELLHSYGYYSVSYVEDFGSYCVRGGIIDVYSPAYKQPVRIELFGDLIESIRHFDPISQRSTDLLDQVVIIPAKETIFTDENRQNIAQKIRVQPSHESQEALSSILNSISKGIYFQGIDFYLPYFYESCDQVLSHFLSGIDFWILNPTEVTQKFDEYIKELQGEWSLVSGPIPSPNELFVETLVPPSASRKVSVSKIDLFDSPSSRVIDYRTQEVNDFARLCKEALGDYKKIGKIIRKKIDEWSDYKIFIASASQTLSQRLEQILQDNEINYELTHQDDYSWREWSYQQESQEQLLHIIPRALNISLKFTKEKIIFIQDKDIFGHHRGQVLRADSERIQEKTKALSFGDLAPGNLIVHKSHGIGIFRGLTVMSISGCKAEFIQLEYKNKDKLYLPIYRIGQIQKYSGPFNTRLIDKLGGSHWGKVKTKVKKHLRDITAELLQIYSRRASTKRPSLSEPNSDYFKFEDNFVFEETPDQIKAIQEVLSDFMKENPMDRLICGDVGFGKTEVAMRAAFKMSYEGRQVAVMAPTTILTMQHFENFKKRFKDWPVEIRLLNRFVNKRGIQETLRGMKNGHVDIAIGTHRLLSNDVEFKDLGLLVIDEEQKFGVKHKEKIRKVKVGVDTMLLSATPIPRTLNMSLVGIRDLSLINTPPLDRLPARTFVCQENKQTIKKAIEDEISRGGQAFFLHNRVRNIELVASELRELLPHARFSVGHGQMEASQLEKVMVDFLNHKTDVLICTTIIESGMDIPRANTMFVANAHQFGLSQLYQLRGRIGRSKERAYCYLLTPKSEVLDSDSKEKLRILQENTELGSGIRIAQHDLELRGAGDFLGANQSGHINSIGHELYMELLEEAISEQKGEAIKREAIEPEINVRISSYIPDKYISDIRVRLAYYKVLSEIKSHEDLDQIESDLQDQFGKIPDEVLNLMGLMLIRKDCKDLGIQDISSGQKVINLKFTKETPLPPEKVVELSLRENKKYSITSDNRLKIRMNDIQWPRIYDEISYLKTLCIGTF